MQNNSNVALPFADAFSQFSRTVSSVETLSGLIVAFLPASEAAVQFKSASDLALVHLFEAKAAFIKAIPSNNPKGG